MFGCMGVLQGAAESLWKGSCILWLESELVKPRTTKWPLLVTEGQGEGRVIAGVPVLGVCLRL